MNANTAQLRLLSDEELDQEFALPAHDNATRTTLLYEKIRRLNRARSRPHWVHWVILVVALAAAFLAGIASLPVIENLDDAR